MSEQKTYSRHRIIAGRTVIAHVLGPATLSPAILSALETRLERALDAYSAAGREGELPVAPDGAPRPDGDQPVRPEK